jgi:7-carboxy-7-deazaguanine synthase
MLLVKEIYPAIIGEGIFSGFPGLLIRLSGCSLRCSYCDTAYAWQGGSKRTRRELTAFAKKSGFKKILLTGGEPLFQDETGALIKDLSKAGLQVLLETNGAIRLDRVAKAAHIIMDLKTPASGEQGRNDLANFKFLKPTDEIKFVLCNRKDYDWAKKMVAKNKLGARFNLNFSPARALLQPERLAAWMLKDRVPARLNLQLHRVLFPDRERGT